MSKTKVIELKTLTASAPIAPPASHYDIAGNIAFFLLENAGDQNAILEGHLSAAIQRKLFGFPVFGTKTVVLSGVENYIASSVKTFVSYGGGLEFERVPFTLVWALSQAKLNINQSKWLNPLHRSKRGDPRTRNK